MHCASTSSKQLNFSEQRVRSAEQQVLLPTGRGGQGWPAGLVRSGTLFNLYLFMSVSLSLPVSGEVAFSDATYWMMRPGLVGLI